MQTPTKLDQIVKFVAQHGHWAQIVKGAVVFRCADGEVCTVTTWSQAKAALGY